MNQHAGTFNMAVHAEWVVEGYRGMVLDGRWREALQSFKEDTDGLTPEIVENILKGNKTLHGITTSDEGVELVDDTFENGQRYRDNMEELFGGCVLIGRRLFRPMTVVTDYGPQDRSFRSGFDPREDFIRESFHDKLSKAEIDPYSLIDRAKHYTYAKDYVIEFCTFDDRPNAKGKRSLAVIFEPGPDLPSWIFPHRTTQAAVDASLERLKFTGHQREYGSMESWLKNNGSDVTAANFIKSHQIAWQIEPEPELATDYSERIQAILKQNEDGGFGMRSVYFGDRAGIREVPNGPLLKWALSRLNRFADEKMAVPDWKAVNPSGMKMQNDDPAHTDWMMAAGFTEFEDRDIDRYMDKLCADVQHEVLGIKTHVLVAGKDYAAGVIKYCKPTTEVDDDTIAIIPNAGVDYIDIARKAAGVITLNGGALSHLAVNGLSEGFLIVRDPKAKKKFAEGNYVQIDAQAGTLELISNHKPQLKNPGF
jgi:phosphohistidine swiveling domain-containing protein